MDRDVEDAFPVRVPDQVEVVAFAVNGVPVPYVEWHPFVSPVDDVLYPQRWEPPTVVPSGEPGVDAGPGMTLDELLGEIDEVMGGTGA